MGEVHDIGSRISGFETRKAPGAPKVLGGGDGTGDGGGVGARIAELESSVHQMQVDLAVIKSNYATKEDLFKAINDQTWKLITWTTTLGAALVAITYWIARTVH